MDCKDFQKSLFAGEESELPSAARKEMEGHVHGCESCSRLLAGYRAFEDAIEAEKALEIVPFAATRILQRLENQKGRKPLPVSRLLQPAIITFLLVAALLTGYLVGNHGTTRKSQSIPATDQVEMLRTELYVADFVEEDNTLLTNY